MSVLRPLVVLACVCTHALVAARPAPPDAEPAAAVVEQHRKTVRDIKRAIERTTFVPLGTGSMLAIVPDMALIDAGIEIRLSYDTPSTLTDRAGEHSAAFSMARALQRATKLKVTGGGGNGSASLRILADDEDRLFAAMPRILSTLANTGVSATDHAAALQELVTFNPKPDAFTLRGRMYLDEVFAVPDPAAAIRATRVAAAVAARKRWRTGHVTIAITGRFHPRDIAKLERLVRAGLKGWKLAAPPQPRHSKPVRTGQVVRVPHTKNPSTAILLGRAFETTDERTALALAVACGDDGVIQARLRARLEPKKLHSVVLCKRTGTLVELVISISRIPDPAAADGVLALVTEELAKIAADGPTVAQLVQPQRVMLIGLDPLLLDRGPKPSELVEDPPLAERAAAADAVLAIRRADVAAALKAHLDPKAFVVVIGTP